MTWTNDLEPCVGADMTYNFDPDKWYDNEFDILEKKRDSRAMTREEFDRAVQALEKKHEEMWNRLSNTYQVFTGR